jgi:hypothetical protein
LLALIVALIVKVLTSTRSIETAATANIAFIVRRSSRELIPLETRKRGVLGEESSGQELLWSLHAASLWERVVPRLRRHHAVEILRRHMRKRAISVAVGIRLLVLAIPLALLARFLLEQRTYTHATSFGSEVASKSIRTSEAPATAPVAAVLEIAAAHKLLLS